MSTRKSFDFETSRAIGRRIREARGTEKQSDFASAIGVDRATLSNYETGRRIPSAEILNTIGVIKGYSANYILFGADTAVGNIKDAVDNYKKLFIEKTQTDPGFYPKWFFSNFEIALLRCFRGCDPETQSKVVGSIANYMRELNNGVSDLADADIYEAASLQIVENALQSNFFEAGLDAEQIFWTFIEGHRLGLSDGPNLGPMSPDEKPQGPKEPSS